MHTLEPNAIPATMSEADQGKVREQMNRMLETHHFKHSRRYPPLLRFIVEETLEGRGEYLKERLLGIKVFDRPPDYDTATDPIVRVTVAEIRKRIAQYYQDEEHDAEIRIELMPGRYAPEFRPRRGNSHDKTLPSDPLESKLFRSALNVPVEFPAVTAIQPALVPTKSRTRRKRWVLWSIGATLALVFAAVMLVRWMYPPAIDQLWSPILNSPHAVLFCLPTDVGAKGRIAEANPQSLPIPDSTIANGRAEKVSSLSFLDFQTLGENIVYSDMLATLQLADMLAVHHHDYRVKLNVRTTLDDLSEGPDVVIGGLDNQWTMRALAPLRFHFAGSDDDGYWVADAQHPERKNWSLNLKLNYAAITRDYAIIARLHNEETGQPELIVAGIGMTGTAAAGEFLSDPARIEELRQRIGKGFKNRDFEAVLSTDVVNGTAGSPKVIAVTSW